MRGVGREVDGGNSTRRRVGQPILAAAAFQAALSLLPALDHGQLSGAATSPAFTGLFSRANPFKLNVGSHQMVVALILPERLADAPQHSICFMRNKSLQRTQPS